MLLLQYKISVLTLIFMTCSSIHLTNGLRILGLFPYQADSHFLVCKELLRTLAEKGHQVDVYSHFPLKEPIQNYNDFSLRGSIPLMTNNMTYDTFDRISNYIDFMMNILPLWTRTTCELLNHPHFRELRDTPRDPPYDLIIMEFSQSNCFIPWGRYLKVPVIGIVTLPALDWIHDPLGSTINLATDPSVFSKYTYPMTFFQRIENVIKYYTTNLMMTYILRENDRYVTEFFGPGYPNNVELMKDFSLILLNHDLSLNGAKAFAPSIVPVGGLHIVERNQTLPKSLQKWLDESRHGCVYFSFGSMVRIETFPKYILEIFYKSFEKIAPVRVLLKISNPEILPPGLPSNVFTYPWLPQLQVLNHTNVKAFVTHGGIAGTQEAVYCGVPMVAIPLFGDQQLNAESYNKRNIVVPVNIHEITEEIFTEALNEVLKNPAYKNAVTKLSGAFNDRLMSPVDTAVFWIEYISRHGKDALRSPIVDMPWWQASLLDVYSFVLVIIVLVLYILRKLVGLFLSILCNRSIIKEKMI